VALIADSGGLYALYDRRDKNHAAVRVAVEKESGPIVLPAAILAELDYLLRTKLGATAEARLLEGIVNGSLSVEPFTVADAARCRELLAKYEDLDLGLADASVVATAERLGVLRILSVDERDFRPIRTTGGKALTLVPADERGTGWSKRS
jgi:predicted nucleic acid-binding protein